MSFWTTVTQAFWSSARWVPFRLQTMHAYRFSLSAAKQTVLCLDMMRTRASFPPSLTRLQFVASFQSDAQVLGCGKYIPRSLLWWTPNLPANWGFASKQFGKVHARVIVLRDPETPLSLMLVSSLLASRYMKLTEQHGKALSMPMECLFFRFAKFRKPCLSANCQIVRDRL